jgi:predicted metal-dependent hydrolase
VKKILLTGIIIAIISACSDDEGDQSIIPTKDVTLPGNARFASAATAKEMLTTEDQFTGSWSQFDIDARLQATQGTKQALLDHISAQALDWATEEKDKITHVINHIHNSILDQDLKVEFDYQIYFIKTTGDEEGGAAGYTRQNYIVLNDNVLSAPDDNLAQLVSHELFHIMSRNDENFRNDMYSIIGFEIANNVPVPDQLKDLRMTNPDAPAWDSFITLSDNNGVTAEYLMITYAKKSYDGGTFLSYLNVGFLRVKGSGDREVDYVNGDPVIGVYADFTDFYEQVGNNTNYTIHPEEILADNFALAILGAGSLPSRWVVDEIKLRLK